MRAKIIFAILLASAGTLHAAPQKDILAAVAVPGRPTEALALDASRKPQAASRKPQAASRKPQAGRSAQLHGPAKGHEDVRSTDRYRLLSRDHGPGGWADG